MIMSLIVFAAVLLIAYWWSNAGAFSAFMHLLCVIFAGVFAFALWEPATYPLLASGFGNYAKGTMLLALFVAFLLPMRLILDRAIKANLSFPRPVDLTVGAAFGLASGVLTMGIFCIGAGYIQSTVTIYDFSGWTRRSDEPKAPTIGSDRAPVLHLTNATEKWFSYISNGAFAPMFGGGTLGSHLPELAKSAGSLYRDSYGEGLGRTSLPAAAISGIKLMDVAAVPLSAGQGVAPAPAWAVMFKVSQDAFDGGGQQFILSASQARLIGDTRSAAVSYPMAWIQLDRDGAPSQYYFNSASAYATSVLSQGDGTFVLLFPKSDLRNQVPKYIELKGVRFPTGRPTAGDAATLAGGGANAVVEDPGATNIDALIDFPDPKYAIQGVIISSNDKGDLRLDSNNYIIGGEQKFPKGGNSAVGSELRVKGFQTAGEQKILRLDAHAATDGARIFPDVNQWLREAGTGASNAKVCLVDDKGGKYYAIGLVEDDGTWVTVKSMGGSPLRLSDIPIQPLGSANKLSLYFRVPPDTKLRGLMLSTSSEDRIVNTIGLTVPRMNQ
jgi:hypothetical protein